MKKLIAGVFLVQLIILVAIGIPSGGAANAVWRDKETGVIVRQDNPANTVESYYLLLDEKAYDSAVSLFEAEAQESLNGDILKAYLESNGLDQAHLVKIVPSNVLGDYAVAASIRIAEADPAQPALSLITLRQREGKWEIVQQLNEAGLEEVREVFERALEVCDFILKDPLAEFNQEQQENIKIQTEMGKQYLAANLKEINAAVDAKNK